MGSSQPHNPPPAHAARRGRKARSPSVRTNSAAPPSPTHSAAPSGSSSASFLRSPAFLRTVGAAAILAALLLGYSPIFHAGYIWDDDDHFTANPLVVGTGGFAAIWASPSAVYYPLVLTTWRAVHSLFGLNPLAYHLLTLFLHGLNALLLWMLLRRLGIPGGWFAAALFALHPVQVESVAWCTELKNTQSGFFYLLSLLCFLKAYSWREAGEPGGVEPRGSLRLFYGMSLGLFGLALASKPSTVMLPAVLLLLVWWKERRIGWRTLALTAPYFLFAALASVWTVWEQMYHSNARGAEWSETLLQRTLNAGRVVWFYLGKLVWPHPLEFIYPRWTIDAGSILWYLPLAVLVAAAVVLIRYRRSRARPFLFAGAYYVALLFPVLGFFRIYFTRFSYVADHFQYLASMGFFALVGAGIGVALRKVDRSLRLPVFAICGAVLFLLGVLTWRQTHMYRNEETLWRTTIGQNPAAWIAENNLGLLLDHRGNTAEAESHYRRAIRLKPDYEEAFCNLAILCNETGRYEEAAHDSLEAIRFRPEFAMAYDTLATAYVHLGRIDDAIKNYTVAVKLNPADALTRFNLAVALEKKGRAADAAAQFEAAHRLDPTNEQIRKALETSRARLSAR